MSARAGEAGAHVERSGADRRQADPSFKWAGKSVPARATHLWQPALPRRRLGGPRRRLPRLPGALQRAPLPLPQLEVQRQARGLHQRRAALGLPRARVVALAPPLDEHLPAGGAQRGAARDEALGHGPLGLCGAGVWAAGGQQLSGPFSAPGASGQQDPGGPGQRQLGPPKPVPSNTSHSDACSQTSAPPPRTRKVAGLAAVALFEVEQLAAGDAQQAALAHPLVVEVGAAGPLHKVLGLLD